MAVAVGDAMTQDEINTLLPELCYVFIHGAEAGQRIGIIKREENGYYLTDFDSVSADNAITEEAVERQNARLGVTQEQAMAMYMGSSHGWDVPGADPRRWVAHFARAAKRAPCPVCGDSACETKSKACGT